MSPTDEYVPIKDPKYCFVPACSNNSVKNATKTFFAVPNSSKQEWCNAMGNKCPKRILYICEDHLNLQQDVENYQYWITMKGRPKLKSRLPQSLVQACRRPSQEIDKPKHTASSASFNVDYICSSEKTITTKCNKGIQVKPKIANRGTYCAIYKSKKNNKPLPKDDQVVESMEEALPATHGTTTSAEISRVSEICVKMEMQIKSFMLNLIEQKPQYYIGLPRKYFWVINYLETELKVNSFDIIITLYKIKNNTPFYQIADMFEVSLTTICRIFFRVLCVLSKFFKQLIFFPRVIDVKRNLPSSFKTNKEYSNVFCIIDCFEIEIEKPSNPMYQSLTWSQYRSANTLKYLLATTPDGFVNFVSAGFGGHISDSNIVESSGFLDFLPPNCTILAVRGFKYIDNLLSKKQIKLLRPPSVIKDTKITKQEAIKSKVIASLRIHVDRVIRRVRLFKFLKPHSVINNKLIQYADDAVIVACGMINIRDSILKSK